MLINKRIFQGYNFQNEAGGEEGAGNGGEGEQTFTAEQFQALQAENEQLKNDYGSMKGKMDQLLGETKRAKAERMKAEEEAARKAGDFEQLFNSSESKLQETQKELENLRLGIANEKRHNEAVRIAGQLADGHNAELLATFIETRIKYTDEGVKVLDSAGQLTVSSLDDLANEFKTDARYSALIKGSQSSGGGATGNNGSGSAGSKVLTRAEFDKLDPTAKSEFSRKGGTITR